MVKCQKCGKEIENPSKILWPFFIIYFLNIWEWRNEYCNDCAGLGNFLGFFLTAILTVFVFIIFYIKAVI